ncbi:MAG: hypothetical protein ACXWZM_03040 [Solirubrobacterales bacterium]
MGILDEAIREHLELKRQHGAAEPELQQLEDEALGAPGGAGEIEQSPEMSDAEAEAPTDYIGSPAAAPPEQDEAGRTEAAEETPAPAPDLRPPEMRPEEPPPAAEEPAEGETADEAGEDAEGEPAPAEEEHPAMELEVPEAAAADAAPEPSAEAPEPPPVVAGGVSADLRAEREEIAQHPTEHYDVEDEIAEAEKEAAGFFNEQSLSDELDQALDSPDLPAEEVPAAATDEVEVEVVEESEGPEPAEVVEELEREEAPEGVEEVAEVAEEDAEVAEEEEPGPEDEASGAGEGEEDVLEETPEFLQDSPEHDRLWFEQKPPKDFDFDD